jgi:glycosyltransferase involved in cell wall biosynthesis
VLRAELHLGPQTLAVVVVGSLDSRKDPLTPTRAAINLRVEGVDVAVLLVGDGPLRAELEALERQAPEVVRVLGFRDDVPRILRAGDVYVLSSEREGLSFALLEAMSYGLPAVVSDTPGNAEALGDAGLVVPRCDVGSFARAFAQLAGDAGMRSRLGERARERVGTQFDLGRMVRQTHDLYDEVLRGARGGA